MDGGVVGDKVALVVSEDNKSIKIGGKYDSRNHDEDARKHGYG